jgi:cobalt-zinc-cadmium resistance protein CzcA
VRSSLLALSESRSRSAAAWAHGRGAQFLISAAIGFISLFVSSMDGILLISYINRNLDAGLGTEEDHQRRRHAHAANFHDRPIRLHRPVPAAISTGIGSQVQQPLACVIVGACCSRRSAACS